VPETSGCLFEKEEKAPPYPRAKGLTLTGEGEIEANGKAEQRTKPLSISFQLSARAKSYKIMLQWEATLQSLPFCLGRESRNPMCRPFLITICRKLWTVRNVMSYIPNSNR
jgi:hypothetical protein